MLVDTSILIDYYRKTDKEKTIWLSLVRKGYSFA
ncbi:MAG: type II toxin-antitoxin system VapC family toxin, partial [Sphingobacteriales bacterium]